MDNLTNINKNDIPAQQRQTTWAELELMNKGIIIRLSIARWRAITTFTPDMLGLKFADKEVVDFVNSYISLGKQKLFPPYIMNEINIFERRARDILKEYSFDTMWGRFVPYTAFNQWKKENDINKKNFVDAANSLVSKYDAIVSIVKEDYSKLAKDVWARLYPSNSSGATKAFVENFTNKVIDKIPPVDEIINTFKYNENYLIIPVPWFAQSCETEQTPPSLENKLVRLAIEQISNDYMIRESELIETFLNQTVNKLKDHVLYTCNTTLQSIRKQCHSNSNDIPKQQRAKLKKMIKKSTLLNFYDDTNMNKLLDELNGEINKCKGQRNKDSIVDKLDVIKKYLE